MFFLYPLGHDQAVYSRPWLTWGFIGLCVAVQIWIGEVTPDTLRTFESASTDLQRVLKKNPLARVSEDFYVDQDIGALPGLMRVRAADEDSDEEVSEDLEKAVDTYLSALQQIPFRRLGYVPRDHKIDRAFTSMVTHGGWWHLVSNLFILFLAGAVLECFWRKWAFAALAVLSGLAGVAAFHLTDPNSVIACVGASGIVSGVMAAFLVGFARTTVRLGWFVFLVFFIRAGMINVKAWILIGIWAVLQVYSFASGAQDGVAYSAHLGGFFVGLALAWLANRMKLVARDMGLESAAPAARSRYGMNRRM